MIKSFIRHAFILAILTTMAFATTGCETTADQAGEATKNAIKEVGEAYTNVKENVDKTKTWVNTKVDQAEKASEDVKEAAESLNNAVNSLKDFTKTTEITTPKDETGVEANNP